MAKKNAVSLPARLLMIPAELTDDEIEAHNLMNEGLHLMNRGRRLLLTCYLAKLGKAVDAASGRER